MKFECPILVSRAQHRPTFSARVVVAADACQRRHLLWHHCLRGTTAWQCRLAGRAQMLEMVESIWCAGVVPTIDRATSAWRSSRRVRQHSLRCIAAHRCCLAGRAQLSHNVDPLRRAMHCPTIDLASRARWRRRCVRQGCLRCTSTRCRRLAGRAQMLDNVDPLRRAVQCRPSMSPPVHGCAAAVCAKVAYDVPVLAVVMWRDERRCRTMSTRPDARCSVDTRSRRPCTVAPPSCAPWLPTM
jgi:hypothetical protein